jgi:hypothetical protein
MRLFCVCVDLCVGSGLVLDWSPFQGVLPTVWTDQENEKADEIQQNAVEP